MAYDHAEQEQLASLTAWWKQYGNLVTWALTIALAGYAAWSGWNYYQRTQSMQASQLYNELQNGVTAKDNAKVQRAASDMQERFARTGYAQMSGLVAAKSAFDAGDMKAAKAQLQWVIDKGADEEFKALAKIRLAGILLDEKAYDEGLKVLAGEFPAQFAVDVADRKGDLLMAQNKLPEARAAWQLALDKAEKKNPGRQLIQLKLDAIGAAVKAAG
ncbi:putative negative regulator of RcsB-dependent stress response [Actimicrobium sp. GrIS 1.19]|uniref:tetratricopeptide repeat protein n=1 Tax=Actimicrobium sp. GrIS 1.19 TaxID=3071708 RepID=UPI002E0B7DAB|nr:putative negative regulator of RcsB-dependent stress response [Actimicrobium sp. GrIS 1.19]